MASGDTLLVWTPQSGVPPPSGGVARQDTRNGHPVLDFHDTTEQRIDFKDALPSWYSGNGLTIEVYVMASIATSGAFVFGGKMERRQAEGDDADSDSFATEQLSSAVTTHGTSGVSKKATITHSAGANMDNVAAGEPFRYALSRKPADGGDTMVGDAEVEAVYVKET